MNTGLRRTVVANLEQLIESFGDLRDASTFLQSEDVAWYEAEKTYVDNLRSWMGTAETILALSGEISLVEGWARARDFEITVLNVDYYGQRMKILLDGLKNAIESGDGSVGTGTQYNVFLSYSSDDEEKANVLEKAINETGGKSYLAKKSLEPGDDFSETIRLALLASQELWVLVSPISLKSIWVTSEWAAAWVLKKRIVPIRLNCGPEALPDQLRRLHSIDLDEHPQLLSLGFRITQ